MRARNLRSTLYVFAIALLVGWTLNQSFAVRAARDQNQQAPKRGKNGASDTNGTTPPSPQTQPGPQTQSSTSGSTASGQGSNPATAPDQGSAASSAGDIAVPPDQSASHDQSVNQTQQSQTGPSASATRGESSGAPAASSGDAQGRPEPPPFDRPPVWSQQRSPSTGGVNNRHADDGANSDVNGDSGSQSQNTNQSGGGYSQPDSERGSSRPPVLQRSPDLGPGRNDGSGAGSGRSGPPVLRRSGDDSTDDVPARPTQNSSDRRSGSDAAQGGGQQGDQTIKLDATLVDIPVVVSDRSGRFIPRLTKGDFDISEDGVRQQVAFFGSEEVPFNVALMLDISPSVSNSARDIQDAALAFIDELRADDKVMIVAFDEHVRFLTDFTNDRRQLTYAIQNTRTGNGTSVYEAVYDTVANRLKYVQGRKAMILFSDGEDTTSRRVKYQDCIDLVSESDVLVYGLRYPDTGGYGPNIGFPRPRIPIPIPGIPGTRSPFPFPFPWPGRGPWGHLTTDDDPAGAGASHWTGQWGRRGGGGQRNYNRDFMRDITEAGGGPVYDAKTIGDMSRLARQIADELRHVYVVSYYPTNPLANGGYRTVRVSIAGRDDLSVRHRKGYYADAITGKSTT